MSFEEWWKTKDYPARCKGNCKEAYEAGMKADVHTDNSQVIAELEAQIEKMKCPQNCKNGSVYNWSDSSICMDCEKVRVLHEDNWQEICKGCKYWELRS